jgi:nucleoside-diphosphate-sugar epimerase
VNSYEASKHEAEELILAESAKLPVGIYRLSSVTDLSGSDGHVRKVPRLAAWAGNLRCFPGDARVPVDIITSDWAAHAMSALLTRYAEPGCIRHLCAGESGWVSLGRILDKTLAAYEAFTCRVRPHVHLVSLSDFERLRGLMNTDETVARAFDSLMTFIPHLSLAQPFDNRITSDLLRRSGVEQADVDSVVSALLTQEFRQPALALVGTLCGEKS